MDYLGVNYYHPRRAKARTTAYEGPLMPEKYYESYEFEGQKMNRSRGWEIYEPAINLGTVNQFFRAHYTPAEAKALIISWALRTLTTSTPCGA